jgi:hypothetical protein
MTAVVVYVGLTSSLEVRTFVHRRQKTQYTYESDQSPSIRAADDRLVMGGHTSHGLCPSGCDNDSRRAGVLSPHGGAVRKLHDAGQSLLGAAEYV